MLTALVLPVGCSATPTVDTSLNKALIVDQLSVTNANPAFITAATHILESYGFTVDIQSGANITVDFYNKLPSMGYRFILLRVHSGTLVSEEGNKVTKSDTTYLFTNENYSTTKYVGDQLADRVSNALMEDNSPLVFAVNSEYIKRAAGTFNRTFILAMGCESYKYDDLAIAFVEKGAAAYIGWSDIVTLNHVDDVTLDLLNNLFIANMTLSRGISATTNHMGKDPYYDSYMKYYPSFSGNNTVAEIIKQPQNEK